MMGVALRSLSLTPYKKSQAGAGHLHQLVGDDGDEQAPFGADGFVVVDGAQAELGFQ